MCRYYYLPAVTVLYERANCKMVSSVNSINQYQLDYKDLEIIRRLQSLGIAPSGDRNADIQRLQVAELKKKQATLASNSEVNLNKLEGTGYDFSATLNGINSDMKLQSISDNCQENGFDACVNSNSARFIQQNNIAEYRRVGAEQLALLNKLRLGLAS